MNEPLPPELRAMQAGLDFIDKALSTHKAVVLSPTSLEVHDSLIADLARVLLSNEILSWTIKHARDIPHDAMDELLTIVGLRKVERDDDPSGYAETARHDFERECYASEDERLDDPRHRQGSEE